METPIRILRVLGSLNIGGIETTIINIYNQIDRSKIQFDFIIHCEGECTYSSEVNRLGGKIYYIPRYNGMNHIRYKKAWNDFFKEHTEYKIIHCHVRSTASIYIPIAKKYGLITIAHSHSTSSGKGGVALIKNLFRLPIRYEADYFLACSEEAGRWLFGKRISKNPNYKVIKNCIDVKKFKYTKQICNEVKKELHIEQDTFVVGHVGRFNEAKNHLFLLELFALLKANYNKKTILLLVGDGELKNEILKKIQERSLTDDVILTGARKDIYRLLQAMDVFVFPSLFEGFGNAVIEAQASGLRCIESKNVPDTTVAVEELVSRLSLNSEKETWISEIVNGRITNRADYNKKVSEAGFDVTNVSLWYEEFYTSLNDKGKTIKLNII